MAITLYDKYGGFAVLNRVVMAFYDNVIDCDVLAPYFEAVEMGRLIDHQTKFLASLLGGPASFTDEHLRHVHSTLGITDAAFDRMKTTMRETLVEHGFSVTDADSVVDKIERRRRIIVTS